MSEGERRRERRRERQSECASIKQGVCIDKVREREKDVTGKVNMTWKQLGM